MTRNLTTALKNELATNALRIISVELAPAVKTLVFELLTASVTKLALVACLKVFAILA